MQDLTERVEVSAKVIHLGQSKKESQFSFFWLLGQSLDDQEILELVDFLMQLRTPVYFLSGFDELHVLIRDKDSKWEDVLTKAYKKWLRE